MYYSMSTIVQTDCASLTHGERLESQDRGYTLLCGATFNATILATAFTVNGDRYFLNHTGSNNHGSIYYRV